MKCYSKIFLYCPPNLITGGPETHHAVIGTLNDNGADAYIFYNDKTARVPAPYKKYNVKVADKIVDEEDNLLIVAEPYTDLLFKYKKIKKAIMFLSVQYFIESRQKYVLDTYLKKHKLPKIFKFPLFVYAKCKRWNMNSKKIDFKNGKYHFTANGEVNKHFLMSQGVAEDRIGYVCGPLNKEFLENISGTKSIKENIVAYNPKKGYEFTKKIISSYEVKYSDTTFVPIEHMSPEQVHELLLKSKVYIDFGSHPGPERIPREAVISNCNIITSLNGSAKFEKDVPILEKFKFNCNDSCIKDIVELIHDMIIDYEKYQPFFETFKKKVLDQPKIFRENVLKNFYYKN